MQLPSCDDKNTKITDLRSIKLWPIFTLEILAFIYYLPMFALAGMGYSPTPNWQNYLLLTFHLYPAWIIITIPISAIFKNYEKYGIAIAISLTPPLISALGLWMYLHV